MHFIKEIYDNANDEIEQIPQGGGLTISVYRNLKQNRYQLLITDNGRGIPHEKVLDCFTEASTSGKFNTKAYGASAGNLGMGAKVVTALSSIIQVHAFREGSATTN